MWRIRKSSQSNNLLKHILGKGVTKNKLRAGSHTFRVFWEQVFAAPLPQFV